jgi:hypothetical protein
VSNGETITISKERTLYKSKRIQPKSGFITNRNNSNIRAAFGTTLRIHRAIDRTHNKASCANLYAGAELSVNLHDRIRLPVADNKRPSGSFGVFIGFSGRAKAKSTKKVYNLQ